MWCISQTSKSTNSLQWWQYSYRSASQTMKRRSRSYQHFIAYSSGSKDWVNPPLYNFNRREARHAGLRTSLVPLAGSTGGMKRWTCSARLFLSLSLSLWITLWQTRACERKRERTKMNECAKFQWVCDCFWPLPRQRDREGDREGGASRLKTSENNKMHPVQIQDPHFCFCVTVFKRSSCTMESACAGCIWCGIMPLFLPPPPSYSAIIRSN